MTLGAYSGFYDAEVGRVLYRVIQPIPVGAILELKRGHQAVVVKRKRGEFLGEAPLGHVRGADGVHVTAHPVEQAAVARIRELRRLC